MTTASVRLAVCLLIAMIAAGCEAPPRQPADVADPAPQPSAAPNVMRTPPPETLPRDRALRAGFLIVDGVYNSELVAPYDILHHTPFHTDPAPGIEVFTVSPDGKPVVTFEGLTVTPHYSFETAPEIDILIVPSAEGSMDRDLEDRAMIDWVRRTGDGAHFVVSLCDGAFVLAEAGLLDGHVVTTFPGDQDRFAETFPDLTLKREPGFVHDGKVMTSQGGAKSYDVAMYLVDHVFGEEVAQGVGRGLIIPWPPETVQGVTIMRTPLDSP